uniref:Uncharacterized protein n=1 Tax=Rangifer tarandus platyrhynchus TaxID=3082113 RepID=A0ACB0FE88_RANTA|nr:unnamed protein product [Rangifer tarandus platyrhynchus]
MPSPSRFPVKRRKVKPYALQREGRPASEAGWRRAAWGGGGLQPGQQEAEPFISCTVRTSAHSSNTRNRTSHQAGSNHRTAKIPVISRNKFHRVQDEVMKPRINYTGSSTLMASSVERLAAQRRALPFSGLSNRKPLKVGQRVMELPVETYCGVSLPDVALAPMTQAADLSGEADPPAPAPGQISGHAGYPPHRGVAAEDRPPPRGDSREGPEEPRSVSSSPSTDYTCCGSLPVQYPARSGTRKSGQLGRGVHLVGTKKDEEGRSQRGSTIDGSDSPRKTPHIPEGGGRQSSGAQAVQANRTRTGVEGRMAEEAGMVRKALLSASQQGQ